MVLTGAVFLAGSLYYAATRLSPLEDEIAMKRQEIAALEAKKRELQRLTETVTQLAKPISATGQTINGWLFVGRVGSAGKWAPPSEGVIPAPNSTQTTDFNSVSVMKDAPIASTIEEKKVETNAAKSLQKEPVQFVRAGTYLSVVEVARQPSIGGGQLVWAKVSVPPDRVLQVGTK
jgi:hypothetical protein